MYLGHLRSVHGSFNCGVGGLWLHQHVTVVGNPYAVTEHISWHGETRKATGFIRFTVLNVL